MNKIVLDQQTAAKFAALAGGAELCAPSGHVIGYFRPAVDPSIYDSVEPPISDEELDRRSKEGGGRELSEILGDLEKQG